MLKSSPKITSDLIITYGAVALSAVVYFLFTLIFSRLLGPYEWGIYSLSKSASAVLITLSLLGINSALVKFIPQIITKKEGTLAQNKLLSSATYIILITTPIVATAWYFLSPWIAGLLNDDNLTFYFRLTTLWLITGVFYSFTSDFLRSHKKFRSYNLMKIVNMVMLLGIAIAMILAIGKDAKWLITSEIFSYIISVTVGIFFIVKFRKFKFVSGGKDEVRRLFSFGLPMAPSALFLLLMSTVDRFFIGYFLDIEHVGFYSVAGTLILATAIIFDPLGLVFFPNFSSLITDPAKKEKVKKYLSSLLSIVLYIGGAVSIAFILLGPALITNLFGKIYEPAILPLQILALNILFYGFYIVFRSFIAVAYKTTIFLLMLGISMSINVVGNWFLIPKFGLAGAAVATMVSYLVLGALTLVFSHKKYPFLLGTFEICKFSISIVILAPALYFANIFSTNIYSLIFLLLALVAFYLTLLKILKVEWFNEGIRNIFKKKKY